MLSATHCVNLAGKHSLSDGSGGCVSTDQRICLETSVKLPFTKKHAAAVFFDLQNTHDTMWKYSSVMKDLFHAGLRGRLSVFISSFLKDRQFQVRLGSNLCTLFDQEMSVPATDYWRFHKMAGFPNVVGCVDGTQIAIHSPSIFCHSVHTPRCKVSAMQRY